ncbi:MAG: hypothetical protein JXQ75_16840 [Phycisphaerae bacterium]|nr:hypothetical protein [Phycisphaerae bacterium]
MTAPRLTLLVVFMLGQMCCAGPESADREADGSAERAPQTWWFRHDVPPGTTLSYHLDYSSETAYTEKAWGGARQTAREGAVDFALEVAGDEGAPSCVYHIAAGKARNTVSMWLQLLRQVNQRGLAVTEGEVLLCGEPLLRGPWRTGDRVTFAWLFFAKPLVVLHADVLAAEEHGVHVTGDLWGGIPLPLWRGHCELHIKSDDLGIAEAHLAVHTSGDDYELQFQGKLLRTEVSAPNSAKVIQD